MVRALILAHEPRQARIAGQLNVRFTNRGVIMATWITHLRVSEGIINRCNINNIRDFLVGSVAPDSGRLNEDHYTYTPASEISHYSCHEKGKWQSIDNVFYNKYVLPNINNDKYSSFLLGYLSHLLTDVLWGHFVYYPTKSRYKSELTNKLYIWEIKKDWFEKDFEYLQQNPNWEIWNSFRSATYSHEILEYYPTEIVNEKLEYIKKFYGNGMNEKAPGRYLSNFENDKFIDKAIDILVFALSNIKSLYENANDTIFENLEHNFKNLSERKWIGDL